MYDLTDWGACGLAVFECASVVFECASAFLNVPLRAFLIRSFNTCKCVHSLELDA